MRDPLSSSRCSGTRILRWAGVVIPTAVVLTGAFGATGAYAANGSAAVHAANASSDANHGVGNGVGNGNDKHADATTTTMPTTTTVSTTAASTTAASTTSTATVNSSSTTAATSGSSSATDGSNGAPHGAQNCPVGSTDPLCNPQPVSTADANTGGANGQCTDPTNMGPYCSTRDGSASGNGNGGGQAVGKPCAGCVGKADNKNPKGQMPNGSDHNAGYECDRNHGIGRTNPAHTGCKTPTTTPSCANTPSLCQHQDCTNAPSLCQHQDCTNTPSLCQHQDCTNTPSLCPHSDCTTNPTAAGCTTEQCPTGEVLANGTCTPTSGCVASAANNNCQPTTPCTPTAANNFCSDVLGEKLTKPPTTPETPQTPGTPTVIGERVVKTPSTLPFTGANVALLFATGFGGIGLGSALLATAGRRRRLQG